MSLNIQILKQDFSGLHWTEQLEIFCLTFMLASIPINSGISLVFSCCWFLSVVLKNSFLKRWSFFSWHQDKSYQYDKNAFILIPMMLYWLAYLISMLWTENLTAGWAEVGENIWFLLIPLTCLCTDFRQISRQLLRAMLWIYVLTITLVFFQLLVKAIIVTHQSSSAFLTSGLMVFNHYIHYTYSTLYIVSGLAFLYTELIRKERLSHGMLVLLIFCACCMVAFVFLLNSRAGILYLILLSFMCVLHTCFIRKKYFVGIVSLIAMMALVAVLHYALPDNLHRLSKTTSEIAHRNMSDSRFQIMENAWTVVKDHPLKGVGAGDRMDSLVPYYGTLDDVFCPHNQFLDTWLATGVLGMLILWIMLLLPMVVAYKKKELLPMIINLLLIVGLMVESMLERQMGIAFVTVINVYYLLLFDSKLTA